MKTRYYVTAFLLLFCHSALAGSIFSGGGVGLITQNPGGRAQGMGILGIGLPDTMSVGSINPALWAGIPVTKFSGGFSAYNYRSEDAGGSDVSDDFNLQYIALAIPVKKDLTIGFKFFPQSRVDYRIYDKSVSSSGYEYEDFNIGKGGISTVSLIVSSRISRNSFLGGELDFVFGNVNTLWGVNFASNSISDVQYTLSNRVFGIRPKLGLYYDTGNDSYFGIFAAAETSMDAEKEFDYSLVDSSETVDIEFNYPASLGIGYNFPVSNRVQSEIDFLWTGWKSAGQDIGQENRYQESQFFGIGFEFQPLTGEQLPLYQRLYYRAGLNYRNLYYQSPAGEPVSDYSVSFGLSFPLKQQFSRFDVSFTAGKRGDLASNGAEEIYYTAGLNISTGERWFVRKKRY